MNISQKEISKSPRTFITSMRKEKY